MSLVGFAPEDDVHLPTLSVDVIPTVVEATDYAGLAGLGDEWASRRLRGRGRSDVAAGPLCLSRQIATAVAWPMSDAAQ